jgi:hypothetical protein
LGALRATNFAEVPPGNCLEMAVPGWRRIPDHRHNQFEVEMMEHPFGDGTTTTTW